MRMRRGAIATQVAALMPAASGGGGTFTQPYNNLYSDFGDSRTVQNNGFYGPATFIDPFTSNKIRRSSTWQGGRGGIGGGTAVQAAAWPRPIGGSGWTCSFNGTVMTITATAGGDIINVGQLITGSGVPANTTILSKLSGTTGAVGSTYQMSNDCGVLSSRAVQAYYISNKTVAEVAADQAANVVILLGTNDGDKAAASAAVKQIVQGLTSPGSAYPNYRPNGESTDQPLPLYNGLAKNIILVDEIRRGVDWAGTARQGGDLNGLSTHAGEMRKLHYASGDALANSRVYVGACFDEPQFADFSTDGQAAPNHLPKAGYLCDGLHFTGVLSWHVARIIGKGNTANGLTYPGLDSLLTNFSSAAVLPDTTTASGNTFLNSNPCFVTQTGGVSSNFTGAGGVIDSGTVPSGWRLDGTNCTGIHAVLTFTALPGNLGYEWGVRIYSTSTPAADWTVTLYALNASSAKRLLVQATDIVKFSYMMRRTMSIGWIEDAKSILVYPTSSSSLGEPGSGGLYAPGDSTTKVLINNIQPTGNTDAVANIATAMSFVTPEGTGTANPSNANAYYKITGYAGQDLDATFYISQAGLSRTP